MSSKLPGKQALIYHIKIVLKNFNGNLGANHFSKHDFVELAKTKLCKYNRKFKSPFPNKKPVHKDVLKSGPHLALIRIFSRKHVKIRVE